LAKSRALYYRLGLLLLAAILLATVGGFSSLFALLIFNQFRGYNRISIFIVFISFLSLARLVNRYQIRLPVSLVNLDLVGLLLFSMFDQTTPSFKYTFLHADIKQEFMTDRAFIKEIEKVAPPNASIFQLPFMPFPESPGVLDMDDYEHFTGYFHSSTLNWSYGSIKGRLPGRWYEYTAGFPIDQMLDRLSIIGFSGIYVNRNGYKDKGAALEKKLAEILQNQPLVSPNQRLSYFDMTAYRKNMLNAVDQATLENLKQLVLYPIEERWMGECSP